jgi:hypothetical protein
MRVALARMCELLLEAKRPADALEEFGAEAFLART